MDPVPAQKQHRMYYLALLCPPDVDQPVSKLKLWMKEHCGAVAALKSPAHITLVAPFWWPEEREQELLQRLENFSTGPEPLRITLNGFSHFNKRVLFVAVQENPLLVLLQVELTKHFSMVCGKAGRKEERPFHPHVTLATRDLRPGCFEQAWEYLSRQKFTATFDTGTISLLKLIEGKWKVTGDKSGNVPAV